jgi:Protein of unknown function, DUF538.
MKFDITKTKNVIALAAILALTLNVDTVRADQGKSLQPPTRVAASAGDIAPLTQLVPSGTIGLPPKLVPSSTVSWIFDPHTGSFELTMKKQLKFKLKTEASVRIGPVITGTISTGKIMVKKGLQGTKPWKPWVQITEVVMKGLNVEFHHFGGPTVVSIADLPDF